MRTSGMEGALLPRKSGPGPKHDLCTHSADEREEEASFAEAARIQRHAREQSLLNDPALGFMRAYSNTEIGSCSIARSRTG